MADKNRAIIVTIFLFTIILQGCNGCGCSTPPFKEPCWHGYGSNSFENSCPGCSIGGDAIECVNHFSDSCYTNCNSTCRAECDVRWRVNGTRDVTLECSSEPENCTAICAPANLTVDPNDPHCCYGMQFANICYAECNTCFDVSVDCQQGSCPTSPPNGKGNPHHAEANKKSADPFGELTVEAKIGIFVPTGGSVIICCLIIAYFKTKRDKKRVHFNRVSRILKTRMSKLFGLDDIEMEANVNDTTQTANTSDVHNDTGDGNIVYTSNDNDHNNVDKDIPSPESNNNAKRNTDIIYNLDI